MRTGDGRGDADGASGRKHAKVHGKARATGADGSEREGKSARALT